ncbi:lysophospholipid acyltransferase family protein [Rhodohalobacter halophilus]|uniref:lysophospholipid acyltransferase family protein n=1 Tax=Rhodohalobacter halophilus TaxID=1812810 RepID=UPI00083FD06E|nr:lysophospholipid acyltransferase family protein [Rhodohalobacter halophilus]
MMQRIKSLLIWAGIVLLILFWLPLLAIIRLFDRDPVRYRTGKWFRKLGYFISKVNPNWNVAIEGGDDIDDRHPYVMVSNHLSNADIPVISNLPWEMKWVAKKELFSLPVAGWMMKMAGDISVDRSSSNKRIGVFKRCKYYLDRNISVIFFPEGTRSRTGTINRFAPGAFDLAIREQVPILPIALDGTQGCLPKKSWVFKPDVYVKMKILDPISTEGLTKEDANELRDRVRYAIADQVAEWRGVSRDHILK